MFETTQNDGVAKVNSFKFLIDCFVFHFLWSFSLRFFLLFFLFSMEFPVFSWERNLTFIFIQKINCHKFYKRKINVFFISFCFLTIKMYYSFFEPFFHPKIEKKILGKKYLKNRENIKTLRSQAFLNSQLFFWECI